MHAFSAVCSDTEQPSTREESINLLDSLIISDDATEDTKEQKILRTTIYNHGEIEDASSFTEEEIFTQLSTFKTGKAPGLDEIDANITQGS